MEGGPAARPTAGDTSETVNAPDALPSLNSCSNEVLLMAEACKVYAEHADRVRKAKESLPDEETVLEMADFFDALGNPTRLKILLALMEGELCTCDLTNITGLSVSAVSHQLRVLKDRRVVRYRKDGKNVFYSLDDAHVLRILRMALAHVRGR